ncbi:hypothetical protein IAR55_006969 [Kwoniella newhampshirensis]|uniref:Peptidase S33 tripeptidyl aminopeptidase-like C-terminal domain-containing protein n=1 Tax=Kwoniella newhampshirensis TaxID=1651941 RepID=A0AAW0YGY6_9TREE
MSEEKALDTPADEYSVHRRRRPIIDVVFALGATCGLIVWCMTKGPFLPTPRNDAHSIEWIPCFDAPQASCATFRVPTNHSDPHGDDTYLALSKINHDPASGPRLGSVYTNFGGPGVSGRSMCFEYGRRIRDLVGGRFDIICWDPRGIGRTVPNVNCYGSAVEQGAVIGGTVLDKTFEVPPNATSSVGRGVLIQQQKQALRLMELQAGVCGDTLGAETIKWMGTTTLIQDMEYLKNVIDGEDALINFHGGSYGTVVAEYLVNMLPEKVGAVIAHGVANPVKWATEHYESYSLLGELLHDAEKSYHRFLQLCQASGPPHCALASPLDTSGSEIQERIEAYLSSLYETGGLAVYGDKKGVLTSGLVRQTIFNTVQVPETWKLVMSALAKAMNATHPDPKELFELSSSEHHYQSRPPAADGYVSPGQGDLARLAVSCADARPYGEDEAWPSAEKMVDSLLQESYSVTETFGLTVNLMEQHGGCQFWPRSSNPAERFDGPWNSTLRTPMLVVSNSHDPITPAKSGAEMAKRYGEYGRHVVQEGTGHSYLAAPTKCYAQIVKEYFETGRLPDDPETYCESTLPNPFEQEESGSTVLLRPLWRTFI